MSKFNYEKERECWWKLVKKNEVESLREMFELAFAYGWDAAHDKRASEDHLNSAYRNGYDDAKEEVLADLREFIERDND